MVVRGAGRILVRARAGLHAKPRFGDPVRDWCARVGLERGIKCMRPAHTPKILQSLPWDLSLLPSPNSRASMQHAAGLTAVAAPATNVRAQAPSGAVLPRSNGARKVCG